MLVRHLKYLHHYLLVLLLVLFSVSCSLQSRNGEREKTIRLVDLNGKPKAVKLYVPQLNARILASQGVKVDRTSVYEETDSGSYYNPITQANPAFNRAYPDPQTPNPPYIDPYSGYSNYTNSAPIRPNSGGNEEVNYSYPYPAYGYPATFQPGQGSYYQPAGLRTQGTTQIANPYYTPGRTQLIESTPVTSGSLESVANNPTPKQTGAIQNSTLRKKINFKFNRSEEQAGYKNTLPMEKISEKTSSKAIISSKVKYKLLPDAPAALNPTTSTASESFYIQMGPYSSAEFANSILSKNRQLADGRVEEVKQGVKSGYRVLLGPIYNQGQANSIVQKIDNANAFIIRDK